MEGEVEREGGRTYKGEGEKEREEERRLLLAKLLLSIFRALVPACHLTVSCAMDALS